MDMGHAQYIFNSIAHTYQSSKGSGVGLQAILATCHRVLLAYIYTYN